MTSLKVAYQKAKEEQRKIRKEIKERTIGYMVAAFGVVAGLAWNEAVKSLIALLFPTPGNDVIAKLIYAALVTIIVVMITVYLIRIAGKDKPETK